MGELPTVNSKKSRFKVVIVKDDPEALETALNDGWKLAVNPTVSTYGTIYILSA